MDQHQDQSRFSHFIAGKSYIHLSEHSVVTRSLFFWIEDLDVLWTLQTATDYLLDQDENPVYEVIVNRSSGVARVQRLDERPVNRKSGEWSLIARFVDPYWVFSHRIEVESTRIDPRSMTLPTTRNL